MPEMPEATTPTEEDGPPLAVELVAGRLLFVNLSTSIVGGRQRRCLAEDEVTADKTVTTTRTVEITITNKEEHDAAQELRQRFRIAIRRLCRRLTLGLAVRDSPGARATLAAVRNDFARQIGIFNARATTLHIAWHCIFAVSTSDDAQQYASLVASLVDRLGQAVRLGNREEIGRLRAELREHSETLLEPDLPTRVGVDAALSAASTIYRELNPKKKAKELAGKLAGAFDNAENALANCLADETIDLFDRVALVLEKPAILTEAEASYFEDVAAGEVILSRTAPPRQKKKSKKTRAPETVVPEPEAEFEIQ